MVKQHTGFINDRGCPDVLWYQSLNITDRQLTYQDLSHAVLFEGFRRP